MINRALGLLRSGEIYSLLRGLGYPKDVIPWRRADLDARAEHVRASLPATPSIEKVSCSMTPDELRHEETYACLDHREGKMAPFE